MKMWHDLNFTSRTERVKLVRNPYEKPCAYDVGETDVWPFNQSMYVQRTCVNFQTMYRMPYPSSSTKSPWLLICKRQHLIFSSLPGLRISLPIPEYHSHVLTPASVAIFHSSVPFRLPCNCEDVMELRLREIPMSSYIYLWRRDLSTPSHLIL